MGIKRVLNSRLAAVGAGAAALAVLAGGAGYAAGEITSKDIQDNTIRSADVKDESLKMKDFTTGAQKKMYGGHGKDGKDGVSELTTGAHYKTTWAAGEYGETITECPEGSKVIGGGYSTWGGYPSNAGYDLGGENRDIEVTVSAPYFKGDYEPVDEAGHFQGDQWVVRGFNSGETDQIVRAWAICAAVN
jgi:hypothetical protein